MLESQFTNGHWRIIYYGTLSEFIEEHKRKSYSMANFTSIIGIKSMHRALAVMANWLYLRNNNRRQEVFFARFREIQTNQNTHF